MKVFLLFIAVATVGMFALGLGLVTYFFSFIEALQVVGAIVVFWIVSAFFTLNR